MTYLVAGNQLTLLQNGEQFFPSLCADIAAAQLSVSLETYIFAADKIGRQVTLALQAAALRGVSVRLMLDGYGSAELPAEWVDELRVAGVEVLWFRKEISPFTLRPNRMRRLRRLHRKLAVIDAAVAYVGGINIIDDVPVEADFTAPRLDYTVRVQGEMARVIQAPMLHLWSVVSWALLQRRSRLARKEAARLPRTPELSLLLRDNLRHRRDIELAYLTAVAKAQHEIIIANAYFLPGRIFRRALLQARRRGVRVVLLLQGRVEYRIQHFATRALYGKLLEGGIEIHEYQASHMHAKVAVIDGVWATVGSSNIDPLSLLLAREANLLVRDSSFAQGLRDSLNQAIQQDGKEIAHNEWQRMGWRARLVCRLSLAVIRVVMAVLGYGKF
ncbi:MAG: cardiolipin synthase ClsB [Gallionella sp.]|nr:cardiolipin synthase ClsB [Gallionella sp.]